MTRYLLILCKYFLFKFSIITSADILNGPSYGLIGDQYYAILGVYQILDTNGNITNNLIRIKSTQNDDTLYNGNWNDNSNLWTA